MICMCACDNKMVKAHVIFRQFLLEKPQCQPIECTNTHKHIGVYISQLMQCAYELKQERVNGQE